MRRLDHIEHLQKALRYVPRMLIVAWPFLNFVPRSQILFVQIMIMPEGSLSRNC